MAGVLGAVCTGCLGVRGLLGASLVALKARIGPQAQP